MGGLVGILSILSLRESGMCCHQSKPRTIGCSAAMSGGITAKEIELIHGLIAEILRKLKALKVVWFSGCDGRYIL